MKLLVVLLVVFVVQQCAALQGDRFFAGTATCQAIGSMFTIVPSSDLKIEGFQFTTSVAASTTDVGATVYTRLFEFGPFANTKIGWTEVASYSGLTLPAAPGSISIDIPAPNQFSVAKNVPVSFYVRFFKGGATQLIRGTTDDKDPVSASDFIFQPPGRLINGDFGGVATCAGAEPAFMAGRLKYSIIAPSASGTIDIDGDGFFSDATKSELKDCCDTVDECRDPAAVNPGAWDIPGNGIDDNCNGAIDEVGTTCGTASNQVSNVAADETATKNCINALDLCNDVVDDDDNPRWGIRQFAPHVAHIRNADNTRGTVSDTTHPIPVLDNSGTRAAWGEYSAIGNDFCVLSTGDARDETDAPALSSTTVNDQGTFTAPIEGIAPWGRTTAAAATLPFPFCTAAIPDVNDYINSNNLVMSIRQPTNARAFAIRAAFASSLPLTSANFGCNADQDFFLMFKLKGSLANATPNDENIALDFSGNPISNQNLPFLQVCGTQTATPSPQCKLSNHLLKNTLGYQQGAASPWSYFGTGANPKGTYELQLIIFDSNIPGFGTFGATDSTVLLDGFIPIIEKRENENMYGQQRVSDLSLKFLIPRKQIIPTADTTIIFDYEIENLGPDVAKDIHISFTPPKGTSFVSDNAAADFGLSGVIDVCPAAETITAQAPNQANSYYRCKRSSNSNLAPGSSFTGSITLKKEATAGGSMTFRVTASCSSVERVGKVIAMGNNHQESIVFIQT